MPPGADCFVLRAHHSWFGWDRKPTGPFRSADASRQKNNTACQIEPWRGLSARQTGNDLGTLIASISPKIRLTRPKSPSADLSRSGNLICEPASDRGTGRPPELGGLRGPQGAADSACQELDRQAILPLAGIFRRADGTHLGPSHSPSPRSLIHLVHISLHIRLDATSTLPIP